MTTAPHLATRRVDVLLALGLLPYLTFLARRSLSIGDALEVALVALVQARLLLSITGYLPITRAEDSVAGAGAVVAVLVLLNLLVLVVPALRRPF